MSMPDSCPRIIIAGREHRDWLRYSIDSDFFTPADAWSMSLGIPAGRIPATIEPWAAVEIRMGTDLVLTGRIDNMRRRIARGEHVLELAGRDNAAILLDCSAPIFVQREVSLSEVCALCCRPLGVSRIDVQGGDTQKKVTVEPGMTAWDALQRSAEANGLWPWFTPEGVLKVGAPDYSISISAELLMHFDGKQNNLLDLSIEESAERRYSHVTVLGQSNGSEDDESDHSLKYTVKDPRCKYYRPLIRNEGHIDSTDMASRKARKIISDSVMESLTITARVAGHRTETGLLWEPGQRIHLKAEPMCTDATFFLSKRVFQGGREGNTTTLTLKPWNTWLPDTATKTKGKKKKHDAEDGWE